MPRPQRAWSPWRRRSGSEWCRTSSARTDRARPGGRRSSRGQTLCPPGISTEHGLRDQLNWGRMTTPTRIGRRLIGRAGRRHERPPSASSRTAAPTDPAPASAPAVVGTLAGRDQSGPKIGSPSIERPRWPRRHRPTGAPARPRRACPRRLVVRAVRPRDQRQVAGQDAAEQSGVAARHGRSAPRRSSGCAATAVTKPVDPSQMSPARTREGVAPVRVRRRAPHPGSSCRSSSRTGCRRRGGSQAVPDQPGVRVPEPAVDPVRGGRRPVEVPGPGQQDGRRAVGRGVLEDVTAPPRNAAALDRRTRRPGSRRSAIRIAGRGRSSRGRCRSAGRCVPAPGPSQAMSS